MLRFGIAILLVSFISIFNLFAQGIDPSQLSDEQLRKGMILMEVPEVGDEDPQGWVEKYNGLRVTDVLDALQAIGIQNITMMDHSIRPLWMDESDQVEHRIYGVAITYQYLPTNKPATGRLPYKEFRSWHGEWYGQTAPELFKRIIRPGNVVVIDAHGIENTGFIGSNNALGWKSRGMSGVVTNGCARDIDEVILERIPVYSVCQGGGTRPGRIEAGAINIPVSVGGVLVRPGDFVVADGDGVVVVPREHIDIVHEIAWDIATGDKESRSKLYEKMEMQPDATIK
jgi:regulator of RNase E activity RraA